MSDTDRMLRAGNFVFGLMDEAERRRAERDIEVDASFRAAVDALSERIREADSTIAKSRRSQPSWDTVSARLSELPHLRRSPQEVSGSSRGVDAGPSVAGRRLVAAAIAVAAGLLLAFCAGYVVGVNTAERTEGRPQAPASTHFG